MTSTSRAVTRYALALALVLLVLRTGFLATRAFDIDELEHAHAAWSVARGEVPYRDFFEHHPPALYLAAAPLFAALTPEVDPRHAVAALLAARVAMWLLLVGTVVATVHLGARWRDRLTGALAAAFAMTSTAFANVMIEFRPDGAAVLCVMIALVVALPSVDGVPPSGRRLLCSGLAMGVALLFTQKAIFAVPGLLVIAVSCRPVRSLAALGLGAAIPVVLVVAWFAAHDAAGALYHYTVVANAQLNGDRTSPFPRLLSHVVLQPALYLFAVAGLWLVIRQMTTRDAVLVASALSLLAGIFVIGRTYDQYYAFVVPVLSLFAADAVVTFSRRLYLRHAIAAAASALVVAGIVSVATLTWRFESNTQQISDLTYVMHATDPRDSVLSGVPGPGTFRPHAWFFFFLSGPFAAPADYLDLAHGLETERIHPRVVVLDDRIAALPPAVVAYIRGRFRHTRGTIYERIEAVR